jgi:hypothetical protein
MNGMIRTTYINGELREKRYTKAECDRRIFLSANLLGLNKLLESFQDI